MKIALPTLANLIKTFIFAVVLSVIGYFLYPMFASETLSGDRLLAYGVFSGALIGGILLSTQFNFSSNQQVSIFVGNLAFKATANDLRSLFAQYGDVQGVRVMTDRATRRPKGFAFVEMDKKAAKSAIDSLDGAEFFGREIKVNYATRRKDTD